MLGFWSFWLSSGSIGEIFHLLQGMCFSLPTPDDPFNDRHDKKEVLVKENRKRARSQLAVNAVNGNGSDSGKGFHGMSHVKADDFGKNVYRPAEEQAKETASICSIGEDNLIDSDMIKQQRASGITGCPSKFLILCLKTIQDSMFQADSESDEKVSPFFVNAWGVEFWKLYTIGTDILETSATCSSAEQIAWIVSTAADFIARREKEGLCFSGPFLLYLVPEKEKALEVSVNFQSIPFPIW